MYAAAAGAGVRGGSGDDGVRGGNGEDAGAPAGGGDHGAPVGIADGPVAGRGAAAGPVTGPDAGGPDAGRVGADGPDSERVGAVPFGASEPAGAEPLEPLVSARIGDGRRVRNQADSTSRKIGGSSIVWSGRGSAPRSSAAEPGCPFDAGAGGAQSSRTRGISAVMSSAGE